MNRTCDSRLTFLIVMTWWRWTQHDSSWVVSLFRFFDNKIIMTSHWLYFLQSSEQQNRGQSRDGGSLYWHTHTHTHTLTHSTRRHTYLSICNTSQPTQLPGTYHTYTATFDPRKGEHTKTHRNKAKFTKITDEITTKYKIGPACFAGWLTLFDIWHVENNTGH